MNDALVQRLLGEQSPVFTRDEFRRLTQLDRPAREQRRLDLERLENALLRRSTQLAEGISLQLEEIVTSLRTEADRHRRTHRILIAITTLCLAVAATVLIALMSSS